MYQINNFTDNDNIRILDRKGPFTVIAYKHAPSEFPDQPDAAFCSSETDSHIRQVLCDLNKGNVSTHFVHWMAGDCHLAPRYKAIGDLFGRSNRSENNDLPQYAGNGTLALTPLKGHTFLVDTADWDGSVVLLRDLFLACEASLRCKYTPGVYHIEGRGVMVLRSSYPREALIEVELKNDVLKAHHSIVLARSGSLDCTIERTPLPGSGEIELTVYHGTGKLWLAPVQQGLA